MTLLPKVLLLIVALGLSACNNPDRYGAAGADGAAGTGIDTTGLGDPGDPASIAYFNQSVGDRVLFAVDQWGRLDRRHLGQRRRKCRQHQGADPPLGGAQDRDESVRHRHLRHRQGR